MANRARDGSLPSGREIAQRYGAQLRFTDIGGHRFTCFATDTRRGQLADLELRHRRRVRGEDRIRHAEDTGLRNLPLRGFDQNHIWCELAAMACEPTAWMQMLALDRPARAREPKRLRLRLFSAACGCASPPPGPGPPSSPPRSPACTPTRPADQHQAAPATRKHNPRGQWNPSHPARQPGSQPLPDAENSKRPPSQLDSSRSRNIEARCGHPGVSCRNTVRGLRKDHAVAALCVCATAITGPAGAPLCRT